MGRTKMTTDGGSRLKGEEESVVFTERNENRERVRIHHERRRMMGNEQRDTARNTAHFRI